MNIEKRRAEIAARKAEIRKLIEGDTENKLNMDDLEKELRELNEEDEKLEKRQAIERMLNGGAAPASPAGLANPVARSANQPGGVKTAGKGASGAYTDDTDQITVAKTASLTEANVIALYGLLGDGYERNAVWCMNKATFFSDFFPLMNKSKNNVIEFANGKYYIMGAEVYFTGSLAAHEAYLGDFSYIIGNYSQDITVVRSEHSGLATNSIDYLGACVFDSKPVAGFGAFVHLAKATA